MWHLKTYYWKEQTKETCSEIHYMLYIGFFASFKSNEFSAW